MSTKKQFMKSTKSLINNSIYTQYVELQRKQITEWNQRQKHKMDVSQSLKGKGKEKSYLSQGLSELPDMEWMIRWMQKMSPVGIDYARRHILQVPNPPSNKYAPMSFYAHIEYEEGEEEDKDEDVVDKKEEGEESTHDYDLDHAFLLEQPTVGGVKFRSPSQSSPT